MDGRLETSWQSGAAGTQHLTVDFGAPRELSGVSVAWQPDLFASHFTVEASDDGKTWRTLRRVYGASGEKGWVRLPVTTSRMVRIRCVEGDGAAFGIREIEVLAAADAASPEAFVRTVAGASRRGLFPRAFGGEPASWAAAGTGGGRETAFLSADGALEPAGGSFSIEPFVRVFGRTLTWADVKTETSLEAGLPPVPSARWTAKGVSLEVTALADDAPGASRVLARYRLKNLTEGRLVATLVLAVRPFLVRPRKGSDGRPESVAPLRTLGWDGRRVLVNAERSVVPLRKPASFNATSLAGGDVTAYLEAGRVPVPHEVEDPAGFASGALAFPLALDAGGSAVVVLELPAASGEREAAAEPDGGAALFERCLEALRAAANAH